MKRRAAIGFTLALAIAVVAVAVAVASSACDSDTTGSTSPAMMDGGPGVVTDAGTPTSPGSEAGTVTPPPSGDGGDCLTGEAADIMNAIGEKVWLRQGFVDEAEGNYKESTLVCDFDQFRPVYEMFAGGGMPSTGTPGAVNPACDIVKGIQGRKGAGDQIAMCGADGKDDICKGILFKANPGASSLSLQTPHTLDIKGQYVNADGTLQDGRDPFVLEVKLKDGKLLVHNDSGQVGWGVYVDNADQHLAQYCQKGVNQ